MESRVRSPRKAAQIYAATIEHLAQVGYADLTVEAVADRAGVNKTTIYRSWPSKDELVAAAVTGAAALEFPIPDTGTLRGDLVEVVAAAARLLAGEPGRGVALAMLAAPNRTATARAAADFFTDRLRREAVIFDRARARGEITDDVSGEQVMDLLAGALWFRMLVRSARIDVADAADLVDAVLYGTLSVSGER